MRSSLSGSACSIGLPSQQRATPSERRGEDPRPQDEIQHLDFTKDPRPLYYKTPPCAFYHQNGRSKAVFFFFSVLSWGKKKTNKHKEFWRDTPWCASRGHVPSVPWYVPSVPGTFCPFSIDLHINQAQMSQVSLGRPEFVPGTPPGHPDRQIPLCDFSLSVFFSSLLSKDDIGP